MSADDKLKPVEDKHEPDDENHGREEKLVKEPKTKRKKRKSEVEKLLEDKIEISPGERRAAAKKDKYYTATDEDMFIRIDKNTSSDLVKVTHEDGRMLFIDSVQIMFEDDQYLDFLNIRNWPRSFNTWILVRKEQLLEQKR